MSTYLADGVQGWHQYHCRAGEQDFQFRSAGACALFRCDEVPSFHCDDGGFLYCWADVAGHLFRCERADGRLCCWGGCGLQSFRRWSEAGQTRRVAPPPAEVAAAASWKGRSRIKAFLSFIFQLTGSELFFFIYKIQLTLESVKNSQ